MMPKVWLSSRSARSRPSTVIVRRAEESHLKSTCQRLLGKPEEASVDGGDFDQRAERWIDKIEI